MKPPLRQGAKRGVGLTSSPHLPAVDLSSPGEPRVSPKAESAQISRRNLLLALVPVLVLLITFLFWYQTWFGRRLSDAEMTEYLADTSAPHKIQHAVAQLSERMARGDATARQWYPQLLALARNPAPQLRLMGAWAMGQDNRSEEFHQALRGLLADPEPLVRWNAALGLVRFGDAAGEPQLRAMLQPFTVRASRAGTLHYKVKELDELRGGASVARLEVGKGAKPLDIVCPISGAFAERLVKDGAEVAADEPIALVRPDEAQVWESLRALYLVGQTQDLLDVERYARDVPGMSERIRRQAELTAQAIRSRAVKGG